MFYETYKRLCEENGDTTTGVSTKVGFSKGSVSYWKKQYEKGVEATPDTKVAQLIADYFGVSVDYLLGRTNDPANPVADEKAPALTDKDERDVARTVEKIMEHLAGSGELMFDGVPMSDEAKAAMAAAMRVGLEEAKRRNKETYTPKKYRKE